MEITPTTVSFYEVPERILDLLGSCDKVVGDVSCLLEEFSRTAGFEPGAETDHCFGVFTEPVRRVAFDAQIHEGMNRTLNRAASDRHVRAARSGVIHPTFSVALYQVLHNARNKGETFDVDAKTGTWVVRK